MLRLLLQWFFDQVIGTTFTHHQKCVLVDTQATGNDRKITAFVGGIDLCDGRYDTPEHRILRDLDTIFKDDYHNPTFIVSDCALFCLIKCFLLWCIPSSVKLFSLVVLMERLSRLETSKGESV